MIVPAKVKRIAVLRRLTQGIGLLLGLAGVAVPAMTHIVFPGLHCHACPLSVTICPVGILQSLIKTGLPLYPLAFVALYGVVLGRWWCGWVCPFGLVNDMCAEAGKPNRTRQTVFLVAGAVSGAAFVLISLFTSIGWLSVVTLTISVSSLVAFFIPAAGASPAKHGLSRVLVPVAFLLFTFLFPVLLVFSGANPVLLAAGIAGAALLLSGSIIYFIKRKKSFFLKYSVLFLTLGFAVIGGDTFFCKLCPSAAASAAIPYAAIEPAFIPGGMYIAKLGILAVTVCMMLLISRFFCRFLCPLGALLGLTNKVSLLKIIRDPGCDVADKSVCSYACIRSCIMGIKTIAQKRILTQTDCIKCGKCIEACPHGFLHFSTRTEKAQP